MRILCLGGAGKISRESALDLVQFCDFEKMTIADCGIEQGHRVVDWLNDNRVDFRQVDFVNDPDGAVELIGQYDIVMDGTPISLNNKSTACIAKAGVDGINLNGCGAEWAFDNEFRDKGRKLIAGMGMTPGITNMMTLHAAGQLDSIETIRISHGAFRSIAFSPSITETTRIEYDPDFRTVSCMRMESLSRYRLLHDHDRLTYPSLSAPIRSGSYRMPKQGLCPGRCPAKA